MRALENDMSIKVALNLSTILGVDTEKDLKKLQKNKIKFENLMMVPGNQSGEKLTNALFNPKIVNQEEKKIKQKALEVIEFLNLTKLSKELAGNLSGGQKKLLELGRTIKKVK